MKNIVYFFVIIFSLVSCTKDETILTAQAVDNFKKYYLPVEKISPEMGEIYSGLQACNLEVSRSAYERFSSLSESQYIEYINFLAHDGSKKYGVSIDTAIYILAKRIDYSKRMFGVMPNKLSFVETRGLASAIENFGLPVMVDPNTWIQRYHHIEMMDYVPSSDSLCVTSENFLTWYNLLMKMYPPGKVEASSCNFLVQQMLDQKYITLRFDPSSDYSLRTDVLRPIVTIFDIEMSHALGLIQKKYSYN